MDQAGMLCERFGGDVPRALAVLSLHIDYNLDAAWEWLLRLTPAQRSLRGDLTGEVDVLLQRWVKLKRTHNYVAADKLRHAMADCGINADKVMPDRSKRGGNFATMGAPPARGTAKDDPLRSTAGGSLPDAACHTDSTSVVATPFEEVAGSSVVPLRMLPVEVQRGLVKSSQGSSLPLLARQCLTCAKFFPVGDVRTFCLHRCKRNYSAPSSPSSHPVVAPASRAPLATLTEQPGAPKRRQRAIASSPSLVPPVLTPRPTAPSAPTATSPGPGPASAPSPEVPNGEALASLQQLLRAESASELRSALERVYTSPEQSTLLSAAIGPAQERLARIDADAASRCAREAEREREWRQHVVQAEVAARLAAETRASRAEEAAAAMSAAARQATLVAEAASQAALVAEASHAAEEAMRTTAPTLTVQGQEEVAAGQTQARAMPETVPEACATCEVVGESMACGRVDSAGIVGTKGEVSMAVNESMDHESDAAIAAATAAEAAAFDERRVIRQSIVCKWWKLGNCLRGDACHFRHAELPPRATPATTATPAARVCTPGVCWDWNLGRSCSTACSERGFLHVCQRCREPCLKGDGHKSCRDCHACFRSERTSQPHPSAPNAAAAARPIETTMEVPSGGFVSFLVGKGGASINALEHETGCRVQVLSSNATVAQIALRGSASEVAAAEQAVRTKQRTFEAKNCRDTHPATPSAAAHASPAVVAAPPASGDSASGEDESLLCVVCLDAPKTNVLLPCGHKCVCSACALDFAPPREDLAGWKRVGTANPTPSACPICRASVTYVARVWE